MLPIQTSSTRVILSEIVARRLDVPTVAYVIIPGCMEDSSEGAS